MVGYDSGLTIASPPHRSERVFISSNIAWAWPHDSYTKCKTVLASDAAHCILRIASYAVHRLCKYTHSKQAVRNADSPTVHTQDTSSVHCCRRYSDAIFACQIVAPIKKVHTVTAACNLRNFIHLVLDPYMIALSVIVHCFIVDALSMAR
jgi:hypothetical protein